MYDSLYSYRDRICIIRDIILKLIGYKELNQTSLLNFCGLNFNKHKSILEDTKSNILINRDQIFFEKRTVAVYKLTQKGIEFYRTILEPL
jgi:predicted transcriptional regulator